MKLKHDEPLSSSAFKFNVRRYNTGITEYKEFWREQPDAAEVHQMKYESSRDYYDSDSDDADDVVGGDESSEFGASDSLDETDGDD